MTSCCVFACKLFISERKHAWVKIICISASQQGLKEILQSMEKYQTITETDGTFQTSRSPLSI